MAHATDIDTREIDPCVATGAHSHALVLERVLNGTPELPVYGITTNGKAWEFGVLRYDEFTQQQEPIAVYDLDSLRRALHAIFRACRDMALAYRVPAAANP